MASHPMSIHLAEPVIVVETDDGRDVRYAAVRRAALGAAARIGATLVFFDRSAASPWTDPYPSGPMTADVEGPHGDRAVRAWELPALGRDYLTSQLRQAAELGVRAAAWLARDGGPGDLADAVARTGAAVAFLAERERRPSLVERLRGRTVADYATRVVGDLVLVAPEGSIRVCSAGRCEPLVDPALS